ncbi:ohcu decarboxylase [Ophiostoma piceae UAMH 11346]|uniref:Ohcu decarboxylase n=1 Tax=Ophiostoma piceae (strain UAMH 11346) TaxID=1262450 RepID=S3C137_OPHP1|nr:ohcu decarboxylase [Ophiostoma piceae UAMH 11346]
MALSLPSVASFPSLPDETITDALDLLFEPSKDLHALALPAIRAATPSTYDEVADIVKDQLLATQTKAADDKHSKEALLSILGAHPRLGAKKVESTQSQAEQAQLQAASEKEGALLAALNAEYEAAFPGLIYVVFVNGRSRDVIMQNMRERIDRGNFGQEQIAAIEAMANIAKDRAGKLPQV